MLKIVLAIMVVVQVTSILGCSQISDLPQLSSPNAPGIVRGAELGGEWRMDQLRVNVDAGDEALVLLRVDSGDEIDGYFYIEKGEDINFQIIGDSLIYEFSAEDTEDSSTVASDRFSFIATPAEGNTYTLTFRNPADDGKMKVTVFLEVIYPMGGSLFTPIERE